MFRSVGEQVGALLVTDKVSVKAKVVLGGT